MAKVLMVQGTMSNVGKSYLVAALCRIFKQDGYRVAPFKSQNMALNSYITKDGLEMGRAQAMQAEAAGIEPDVRMNPILLKPTTDMGSQVIVNGEVFGNLHARDYFQKKKELVPQIRKAFTALSEEYDIIVIEGAGSPVELNLKKDDFVNMGMALMVNAPVLLVGDIDRGGVFAQLIGTINLLEPQERNLVKGLIVNKFRGDGRLFKDGERILEEKTLVPVLGVVPYLDVDIEDEDSLSDRLNQKEKGLIDIVVIKFPKISNYTDFDVFSRYKDVKVRYVDRVENLDHPDLVILPGSKSTIADLLWMKETGLAAKILQLVSEDVPLFGICGGYQMLGEELYDPEGMECLGLKEEVYGNHQNIPENENIQENQTTGLGLLPIDTIFAISKTRTNVSGKITNAEGIFAELNGLTVTGYEIHMGESHIRNAKEQKSMNILENGKEDGACKGNVYGTYLHGFFDNKKVSSTILRTLFEKKGIPFSDEEIDVKEYKEAQYNKLAQGVREALDMEAIYRILQSNNRG